MFPMKNYHFSAESAPEISPDTPGHLSRSARELHRHPLLHLHPAAPVLTDKLMHVDAQNLRIFRLG